MSSNNVSEYLNRVHYHMLLLRQTSLESSPRTLHATTTRRLKDLVSNATFFVKQVPTAMAKDFTFLWQVQPLLRRMQLSVGTPWIDFALVPIVAVLAGWSQYSSNIFGVYGKLLRIMMGFGFRFNQLSNNILLLMLCRFSSAIGLHISLYCSFWTIEASQTL